MTSFAILPGVDINIFLLIFTGLGAGVLSGFAGVGGAFVVTPALIILGLPSNLAVGSALAWVAGNSIIAVLRHRKLGNVDTKLGLMLAVASISGMEVGVRILNWTTNMGLADEVVLSISICMLITVGTYTLLECSRRKRQLDRMLKKDERPPPAMSATPLSQKLQAIKIPPMLHFAKSGVTMSPWIMSAVGFFVGTLAGIIGVGGGFIMVPSLVYLIGIPSFFAVGTDLFQIIFSASYGCIRHAMSGNVLIPVALTMLAASCAGVQFGVWTTRYVRGVSVRCILGFLTITSAAGAMLKLADVLLEGPATLLEVSSVAVTFGGMGMALILICALFLLGFRYTHGQPIPAWLKSFVAKEE